MFGNQSEVMQSWPNKHLGDLLDFLTSGSRGWARYYTNRPGNKFLRIQNIGYDELLLHDVSFVDPPETKEAARTTVAPGDVLLSITADLGRTAVIPEGFGRAFINQHLSILRTSSKIESEYLSAYLSSPSGQEQIWGRNRQGVKAGLNFDDIRSFVIPVPPVELQREFISRQQSARAVLNKQREHAEKLDDLLTSLQAKAFRGEL
jgi:type I restriction enzyme S subunit